MKARIGSVPIDRQAHPRRIIQRIFRNRSDQHRIDAHLPRQKLKVGATSRLLTGGRNAGDRKSTRLNSSHPSISYAVFCLKKKKKNKNSLILNYITSNINTSIST